MDSYEYNEFVLDLFEKLERIAMALENLSTGLDEALTHFGVESFSHGLEPKGE